MLTEELFDMYMSINRAKELMEAIKHKCVAFYARHELCVIERYHDCKMVDNRSMIE